MVTLIKLTIAQGIGHHFVRLDIIHSSLAMSLDGSGQKIIGNLALGLSRNL
jgi:hypothetical protein